MEGEKENLWWDESEKGGGDEAINKVKKLSGIKQKRNS